MGFKFKKIVKPVNKYFKFCHKAGKKLTKAVRHAVRKVNPLSSHSAQTVQQDTGYYGRRISELM